MHPIQHAGQCAGILADSGGWADLSFADDFGPLAAVATLLGLGWLAVLLYVDAIVSPAETGLIYTTVTSRISYALGRNGNAPRALSRTSDRGVPVVSLVVTFVVGLIIFLPFPSWQQLVGFITSATVLSFGSGPLVLAAMRRQLPDHERPFRVPGGHLIPVLAFWCSDLIVYWSGWSTVWKLMVAVLLGLALLAVFEVVGKDKPPLDWKAGATWVLPWLGGLTLLSWLGDYAGGIGVLHFAIAIPIFLVFSVVVYAIAYAVRLPAARVEGIVAATRREAEVEEVELGATP